MLKLLQTCVFQLIHKLMVAHWISRGRHLYLLGLWLQKHHILTLSDHHCQQSLREHLLFVACSFYLQEDYQGMRRLRFGVLWNLALAQPIQYNRQGLL